MSRLTHRVHWNCGLTRGLSLEHFPSLIKASQSISASDKAMCASKITKNDLMNLNIATLVTRRNRRLALGSLARYCRNYVMHKTNAWPVEWLNACCVHGVCEIKTYILLKYYLMFPIDYPFQVLQRALQDPERKKRNMKHKRNDERFIMNISRHY